MAVVRKGLKLFMVVTLLGITDVKAYTCGEDDDYTHSLALVPEDVFHVNWKFDNDTITFCITAMTLGWVGFGISETGGMAKSDVIMGWVKDGETHFHDRYSPDHGIPTVDESQDWKLLESSETETHTTLIVSRYLKPCDDQDVEITPSTMRIIWAFHVDDPASEELTYANYHGVTTRGSRSVQLLSHQRAAPEVEADAFSFDLLARNASVPSDRTTYWCEGYEFPAMAQKHHLVKFEPMVQPGNEGLVHHILLYLCDTEVDPAEIGRGGPCHSASMPTIDNCQTIITAWAIGGEIFSYPEHVGLPLGGPDSPRYVRMEIHYDNPMESSEWMDNSGLRLWLTPTPREYDSSVLEMGVIVGLQYIPQEQESHVNVGWCHRSCTAEALAGEPEGIKLFAVMLHTHLAGYSVRLRHFRNGVELPSIDQDDSYDFNYQEARMLQEEVVVLPGDDIMVECSYNTMGREEVVVGGLETENEMCLGYAHYYPKVALTKCESAVGPTSYTAIYGGTPTIVDGDWVFASPPELVGYPISAVLYYTDWANEPTMVNALQTAVTTGDLILFCRLNDDVTYSADVQLSLVPPVISKLEEDEKVCYQGETRDVTSNADVMKGSLLVSAALFVISKLL